VLPLAGSAQPPGRINIARQNAAFEEVVREIEAQSNYTFIYSTEAAQAIGRVTVNLANANIRTALDVVLNGKPYTYQIDGNAVILRPRPQITTQRQRISGTVVDTEGRPILGASVVVVGSPSVGISTDAQGRFEIDMPAGRTVLQVSFIGMKTKQVDVSEQTEIRVVMTELAQSVEQVIVTGIFNKAPESYTGAAVMINAEQLRSDRKSVV
jgi:hypothetical protein